MSLIFTNACTAPNNHGPLLKYCSNLLTCLLASTLSPLQLILRTPARGILLKFQPNHVIPCLKIFQQIPILLKVKANALNGLQSPTQSGIASYPHLSLSELISSSSFPPYSGPASLAPCCSLVTPSSLLLQNLCLCYSLCLKCSYVRYLSAQLAPLSPLGVCSEISYSFRPSVLNRVQ